MKTAIALLLLCGVLEAQAPLSPFQREKARTLLRTQLPCLGCHELDAEGGRRAPSLTTVGARRSARYIREMIEDPQGTLPGAAMPKPMLAPAVRELVVRYFADGARGADPAPMPAPGAANAVARAGSADGGTLYIKWCSSCHGSSGNGDGPDAARQPVKPARHADAAAMSRRSDDALYDVIAVGGPPYGRSARMPAFGATLTGGEIRALVAHIRSLCKCAGQRWATDGTPP